MKKNKDILFATSNKGKIKEFKKIFKDYNLFSLSDFQIGDAIEDGNSFFENALIKAKHGAAFSNKYTIADDSGLVIPELNYEPGIYSARYAGDAASDLDNRNKVIKKIENISKQSLDAYYVCVLVGLRAYDDPMPIISEGKIYGRVSINSIGDGGFGYDKIFYPRGFDLSMAQIDSETKNKISHRAIASKNFLSQIK